MQITTNVALLLVVFEKHFCTTLWYSLQYVLYVHSITTVYRRIVNTPATAKLAIEDEHIPAHCFAFFSGSQKTLKFKLIR